MVKTKMSGLKLVIEKEYCTASFSLCLFFPIAIQTQSLEFFSLPFNKVSKGLQLKNIFEVAFQIFDWAQETNFCISLDWFIS